MDRNQTSQSGNSSWTNVRPGPNVELIRDLNESLIAKYIENDRSNGLEKSTFFREFICSVPGQFLPPQRRLKLVFTEFFQSRNDCSLSDFVLCNIFGELFRDWSACW